SPATPSMPAGPETRRGGSTRPAAPLRRRFSAHIAPSCAEHSGNRRRRQDEAVAPPELCSCPAGACFRTSAGFVLLGGTGLAFFPRKFRSRKTNFRWDPHAPLGVAQVRL